MVVLIDKRANFLCFVVGLPHLATYIFSMNEPELDARINPKRADFC
jgi:hypothetical protein